MKKKLLDITPEYELFYDTLQLVIIKKDSKDYNSYFNTTKGIIDSFAKNGIEIQADKIAALNDITTSFKNGNIIVKHKRACA